MRIRAGEAPAWKIWPDAWILLAILLVSAGFAAMRWTKLNSLIEGDPAMWLFQVSRFARGETPYLDFSWNYPPLAVWLFGSVMRAFGITFEVAQVTLDVLSLLVVGLSYWVARYFLPRMLHFPAILLLLAVGGTAQTMFTLFSLITYSPSLQCATIGLLLMVLGSVRALRCGELGAGNAWLLATGAYIAEMSKPEAALAALVMLAGFAWLDARPNSLRRHAMLMAASTVPAMVTYAWMARRVGGANLVAGVTGYGLASLACPWWPTGLGVFGAVASLSEALVFAVLASLPLRRAFTRRFGARYRWACLTAIPAAVVYLGYYVYLNRNFIAEAASWKVIFRGVAPLLFWTNPVFLPVMWFSICYWIYLAWLASRRRSSGGQLELLMLMTPPVAMSSRTLFGWTLYPTTQVAAACYAFFILLAPILLWRVLAGVAPLSARPVRIVAIAAVGYALLRVVGGYPLMLSDENYETLHTVAGDVALRYGDASAEIYAYAESHTLPSDSVLDIPYGGGINFALGRHDPLFTVQFQQLKMPLRYQQKDLAAIEYSPPRLVIAQSRPHYGVVFGWDQPMACPCPRLVWQPDQLAGDPAYVFPFVSYLEKYYRIDAQIGDRFLMTPRDQPPGIPLSR